MRALVRRVYDITLAVRSPFLFRGLSAKLFGVDAAQLRDEDGVPIIPSDQIRGVLRQGLEDLARLTGGKVVSGNEIEKVFGALSKRKSGDYREGEGDRERGNTNDPLPGRIHFSDLKAIGLGSASGETTRVKIDEETGAAETGALLVLELVAPFDEVVRFKGKVVLFDYADGKIGPLLGKALAVQDAIGSFKSSGFGEIVQAESSIVPERGAAVRKSAHQPDLLLDHIRLRVKFDRPVLVAAERIAENASAGAIVLPGAVFKGALAVLLCYLGEDSKANDTLSKLVFGHAFPEVGSSGRKGFEPLPLSLVAAKTSHVRHGDALLLDDRQGAVFEETDKQGKTVLAPALFATDWKSEYFTGISAALDRVDCKPPSLVARTHVAIDPHTGTAREAQLFTTLARSAKGTWLLDISFDGLSDEEKREARRLVGVLMDKGLDGVGVTGARADFELVVDAAFEKPAPSHGTSDEFTLMLLTPAMVLDPKTIWDKDGKQLKSARTAYGEYFSGILQGAELVSFFAEQCFAGGYQARRFRAYGQDTYFPFMLTKAGSIFRFRGGYDPARLSKLLAGGLPIAALEGAMPLSWRNCPFLPENGYGAVTMRHLADPKSWALTRNIVPV